MLEVVRLQAERERIKAMTRGPLTAATRCKMAPFLVKKLDRNGFQVCGWGKPLSGLAGSSLWGSSGSFERRGDDYTPTLTKKFEKPEGTIRNEWVG